MVRAPEYLCDLITKQNVSVGTRRAEDCYLLSVPPISKSCANSFFERYLCTLLLLYGTISVKIYECWTLAVSKVVSRQNCT